MRAALERSPVVVLSGPRQIGKTTLARRLLDPASINHFDLEDPAGMALLDELMTEPHDEAFFWATHQGAEIDLILRRGGRLLGVECKRTDAPRVTPSIRNALANLGLERVAIVYPGDRRYPLSETVEAVPASELADVGRLFAETWPRSRVDRARGGAPEAQSGAAQRALPGNAASEPATV